MGWQVRSCEGGLAGIPKTQLVILATEASWQIVPLGIARGQVATTVGGKPVDAVGGFAVAESKHWTAPLGTVVRHHPKYRYFHRLRYPFHLARLVH